MKLWQKETATQDWVTRFTVGEDYRWDTLLLPYDVEGTRAHAWALREMNLLSGEELQQMEKALRRLEEQLESGKVEVRPEDEDSHTVIENFLTHHLGETGKKIHTGRSRNDQVLVALRLFLRQALQETGRLTLETGELLCQIGEKSDHLMLPGYTHMQRAMPSSVALWALGFAELLASDLETLRSARQLVNVSPWGSAAGYGVPYLNMPRHDVARRLGFSGVQTHVTAVQLSRGKLEANVLHALVQIGASLNRLASDLVLYSTSEFAFVKLPESVTTGSSIMPQKRNPDVLELARATYHRLTSELHLLLNLPANLPSGYHRDLQLTKEAVMRSVVLANDLLFAMQQAVAHLEFNEERMAQACTPDLFATAHALEMVQRGIPFREAYRQTAAELDSIVTPLPADALGAYETEGTPGRVNPAVVRAQLARHTEWINLKRDENGQNEPIS